MSTQGRALRVVVVLVVLAVGIFVALGALDSATRGADESGPQSSSFSTAGDGTAAYASLLRRYGATVDAARGSIVAAADRDPDTLVLLDAESITGSEARALRSYLRRGGRLVAGGDGSDLWLSRVVPDLPDWQATGRSRRVDAVVDGSRYRIVADGAGRWSIDRRLDVVAARHVGRGVALLLADTSPLQNRLLGQADDAAFAVALAGGSGERSVAFAEGPHGYGESTGLGAIPTRWKVALVMGALAALLTIIAAGRRLGPPEDADRDLPPARREYADALGAALARTRQPAAALTGLQRSARDRLARRAGLPPDADDDAVRLAARRAGWSDPEIEALFTPAGDREAVLAAGRALAQATTGTTNERGSTP